MSPKRTWRSGLRGCPGPGGCPRSCSAAPAAGENGKRDVRVFLIVCKALRAGRFGSVSWCVLTFGVVSGGVYYLGRLESKNSASKAPRFRTNRPPVTSLGAALPVQRGAPPPRGSSPPACARRGRCREPLGKACCWSAAGLYIRKPIGML